MQWLGVVKAGRCSGDAPISPAAVRNSLATLSSQSLVSFYVGLPGGDTNAPTACAPGKIVFERNLEVPTVLW